jgi:hypothetical protein
MESTSLVIEHKLDQIMLDQIQTLRTLSLEVSERMLKNLDETKNQLLDRGLITGEERFVTPGQLRHELQERINLLRSRLSAPKTIYSDELALYSEYLDRGSYQHH